VVILKQSSDFSQQFFELQQISPDGEQGRSVLVATSDQFSELQQTTRGSGGFSRQVC